MPRKRKTETVTQPQTDLLRQRRRKAKAPELAPEKQPEDSVIITRVNEAVKEALDAVAAMPYPGVGLRTITGILRGETRANWLSYIARTESWGAFLPNPLPAVEAFLRELIRTGYLEGTHFMRITELGQKVLEEGGEPIIRRRIKLVSRSVRPLLWKLLLLRARLVTARKAPGLLKDDALLQILQTKPTSVDELKQLKGIGKFVLSHMGESIVEVVRAFKENSSAQKKEEPAKEKAA